MDAPLGSYADRRMLWAWVAANLLPMWLMTLAVSAEGFSHPPGTIGIIWTCVGAALLVVATLALRGWLSLELLLFDLAPIYLMLQMSEVPLEYRTPFLLIFAGMMTVGGLVYGLAWEHAGRWWVVAGVLTLLVFACANAVTGVWAVSGEGAYQACFPGCVPWWNLLFGGMQG